MVKTEDNIFSLYRPSKPTVPPKGKFPSSSAHRASCIEYRARNMRKSSIGHRVSSAIVMQALFSQHNLKQKINLLFRICRKLSWIHNSIITACVYTRVGMRKIWEASPGRSVDLSERLRHLRLSHCLWMSVGFFKLKSWEVRRQFIVRVPWDLRGSSNLTRERDWNYIKRLYVLVICKPALGLLSCNILCNHRTGIERVSGRYCYANHCFAQALAPGLCLHKNIFAQMKG